jgi:hypothetical protein
MNSSEQDADRDENIQAMDDATATEDAKNQSQSTADGTSGFVTTAGFADEDDPYQYI